MPVTEERKKVIDEANASLVRMQSFDALTLPRVDILGTAINFADAVEPAERLVDLYRQLPAEVLDQLPDTFLGQIKQQADNDYRILSSILAFEPGTPKGERDARLDTLKNAYDPAFTRLHPFISYAVRKSTDFSRLEREARALIQNVTDRATELQQELEKRKKEADEVLQAVRKVAEEQGVSQQAIYFKNEADKHTGEADIWLKRTIALTVVLGVYAVATLFLHKWEYLSPASTYETAQLAVSKILIFITISFFLVLSSKNYIAHRHNVVVNRHRQNALATYEALVKASADASRDVVLAKAAECIFSAQSTGFGKGDGVDGGSFSVNVGPGNLKSTITS